ncbi:MAG TPA: IS1595 family transposase [Terriglobia bacterium]|nr:IS1595 family transposase [Terriglobia bacterium]
MNLAELTQRFSTEEQAIDFLEKALWPEGPVCPHCGLIDEAFRLQSKGASKNKMRPGVWKCKGCRLKFTVKIGTIFEDSHIPLRKWLLAIHLLCASKKGMSSHQIHRQLGITYKSAWFMTHRIRHAMSQPSFDGPLGGIVEVDETYIGGKLRTGPQAVITGERPKDWLAGTSNKAPVVSLVERGGKVRSIHVANVTAANLKEVIRQNVEPTAHVMTDESCVYDFVGKQYARHSTVNHSEKEYARTESDGIMASTNTVEGFFSLLKRGVYGSFHRISKEHLHRYLSEFDFRYNSRDVTDGERRQLAIKAMAGKRLTYYPAKGGRNEYPR